MSCYKGTNYKQRNVNYLGDDTHPSSIDYITNIAQSTANEKQEDVVIYIRKSLNWGTYYDYESVSFGRETFLKLVRFNRKDKGKDVLRDNENGQPESAKSKKGKGKRKKAERGMVRS